MSDYQLQAEQEIWEGIAANYSGPRSWAPEVLVEGKWSGNGLRFETREECEQYGRDLLARWFVPVDSRAVESSDPPNYRLGPAGVERIEERSAKCR